MKDTIDTEIQKFIDQQVKKISPIYTAACLSYFIATNSGKEEDYTIAATTQFEQEKIYSDTKDFEQISDFRKMEINDPLLKRQIEILFLSYQSKQVDEKKLEAIVQKQNKIEQAFSIYRAKIDEQEYTDNQIEEILSHSHDSEQVKNIWIASKAIGSRIAPDVIEIVKMRNNLAQDLGYKNFHDMSLRLDEQDPEETSALFEELDLLTRDAFITEKESIDSYLANKFSIEKNQLMPRHYQNRFFQEAPEIYQTNLDRYYTDKDIVEISRVYYKSIGLTVESILEKSDLYERPGKYQHAYCIDIDKLGDVRIVCNIQPNSKRMGTQLHELGHAVYDVYLDKNTPYILREPAHTFTTEAIAMLFGRFTSNPQWIQDNLGIDEKEKEKIANDCFNTLRLEQLTFSRRVQVMYRFEKNMYENPDQDLNTLRRDLVEKYQMIKRPAGRNEPDRATKIHVATAPCYYHNYLLGELLASQIYYYIVGNILHSSEYRLQSFYGNAEVGTYLKEKIFYSGLKYHWNTMIELATGEKLTPKYYAQQFVQ